MLASADPLSCEVNGLTSGTTYTFTVKAHNDGGTSVASLASASVVALYPARTPVFNEGALERVDGGFTVPVTVESYGDRR